MVAVGALLAALLLAWLPWRGRLNRWAARLGFAARTLAILGLILLLVDPGFRGALGRGRLLVLLDNSVSTHARTTRIDSARAKAPSRGEVVAFGEVAPGEPGGSSRLRQALVAATAAGRPVEVLTDGELDDLASIPPDLVAQASFTVVPRAQVPDMAVAAVQMPDRIAVGDSLSVRAELVATDDWAADSAAVELRLGTRVLLRGAVALVEGAGRHMVQLRGVLPADLTGDLWLTVARAGDPDGEPDDDLRWHRLRVTPTPGIVVVASQPDWDARNLYRTLADVSEGTVRGYVQLAPGRWFGSADLTPVSAQEVRRAAESADLLAVRGDTTPWRLAGRSRLLWPAAKIAGDWYPAPGGLSPVSAVFGFIAADSLPPLAAASGVTDGAWTGMVVHLARRGAAVPVMVGRTGGSRSVVLGADGFHQWAFRGGESEQAWRSLLAGAVTWLLQAPAQVGATIEPIAAVTPRGQAVRFRHRGGTGADPSAISFTSDSFSRTDTLRWDSDGQAQVVLPVGRYTYQVDDSTTGAFAVEPYSAELFPGEVALSSRPATVGPAPVRRSLSELLPLFALVVVAFAAEWLIRRRLGLP